MGLLIGGGLDEAARRLAEALQAEPELFEVVAVPRSATAGPGEAPSDEPATEASAGGEPTGRPRLGAGPVTDRAMRRLRAYELGRVRRMDLHRGYGLLTPAAELGLTVSPPGRQVDVVVDCTDGGPPPAELVAAARFGVLRVRLGDGTRGPGGFWEVLRRDRVTPFDVLLHHCGAPQGRLLDQGRVQTSSLWLLNQAHVRLKANALVAARLRRLAREGGFPTTVALPRPPRTRRSPGPATLAGYLLRTYTGIARSALDQRIGRLDRWTVGFLQADDPRVDLRRATLIPPPPGGFIADPFVVTHQGRTVIFVEDLRHADGKGRIHAYEVRGTDAVDLGCALDEPWHLSYPYLLRHDGELYLVPETSGAGQIRLYRCVDFPLRWELDHVLMDGVEAVDTVVFPRDGRWYLLTNLCSLGIGELLTELHAFVADDLRGPWAPLPANPLLFDAEQARNGGFFTHADVQYRVNQIQGFHHYGGGGFQINAITELTPDTYREAPVRRVRPCDLEADAAHHFHAADGWVVFDVARTRLHESPVAVARRLAGRVLRRPGT